MNELEKKLREIVLSKYKSLREFSLILDMPYSTLDAILKRGVDKATLSNVFKISRALELSLDALASGYIEKKTKKANGLNDVEVLLVSKFNDLNIDGQRKVISYISDLIASHRKKIEKLTVAAHFDNLTKEEKDMADKQFMNAYRELTNR